MADYQSYQTWRYKVRNIKSGAPGVKLESANDIRLIPGPDGEMILIKVISRDRPYVARIKALGEVAYALLDWTLNPDGRVAPNVYAQSPRIIIREFLPGRPGELWREHLHGQKGDLETADLIIVDRILESQAAQRIALLDFIFLCQDRSARNWIEHNGHYYAIDNGMLWPYKGRFADKETIRTGRVDHLTPPMQALVTKDYQFRFGNGLFTTLYAGYIISDTLLAWLYQIDWERYFNRLGELICPPLRYHGDIIDDWRIQSLRHRAAWLVDNGSFPTAPELHAGEWQKFLKQPKGGQAIWNLSWEM